MGILKKIGNEWAQWVEAILMSLPGATGAKLRSIYFGWRFKNPGKLAIGVGCEFISKKNISFRGNSFIGKNVFFSAEGGNIVIGDNSRLNMNVHINASDSGKIVIGDNCLIGPGVVMRATNHRYDNIEVPILVQGHEPGEILICDNVWIGANTVILANVCIGEGAIIGAGSVVNKSIPAMSIAAGVPAKIIKSRSQNE